MFFLVGHAASCAEVFATREFRWRPLWRYGCIGNGGCERGGSMSGVVGQHTLSCHRRHGSRNSRGACFVSLPNTLPHIVPTLASILVSCDPCSALEFSATYPLAVIYFRPRNRMFEPSSPSSDDLSLQPSVDEATFWPRALRNSL